MTAKYEFDMDENRVPLLKIIEGSFSVLGLLINDIINDIHIFFKDVNNTTNTTNTINFVNKINTEILKINNKDILKTYLPKIKSLLLQNNVPNNLIDDILNNTV